MRIYVLYLYILVECKFVHSLLQQQTTSLVVTNMNMTISGAPLNARVGASANEPGKVSNWNEWLSDVTPAETYLFTVAAVQGGYIQIYIHVCLTKYRAWLEGSEVLGGSFLCRLLIAYLHIFIHYKNNVLIYICVYVYIYVYISAIAILFALLGCHLPIGLTAHHFDKHIFTNIFIYICAYTQVYLLSFNWALDIRATFVSICLFSHIFHFFIFPFAYLHILFHSFFNWSANT